MLAMMAGDFIQITVWGILFLLDEFDGVALAAGHA